MPGGPVHGPVYQPAWIEQSIAITRAVRPPVVIVIDWAVNGTEKSRFSNWAAPYIEVLNEISRDKLVRPGVTIYLL